MDVSKWPLGKIMQLPDHFFGRRYVVGLFVPVVAMGTKYDISEMALPEYCVIWELVFFSYGTAGDLLYGWSFVLGDQLPTTDAEFDANELLFKDLGGYLAGRKSILCNSNRGLALRNLRILIHSAGRRIIGRYAGAEEGGDFQVAFTISSIPKEVPDCLISGPVRSL